MTAKAIPASVARAMTGTRASRKTLQLSALRSSMRAKRKGAVKNWRLFSGFRALRPSWATPAAPVAPVRRAGSRQRERPSDHGELAAGSAERFVGPRGRKRGPASRSCPSCGCARLGRDRRRSGRSGETPQSQTGCARRPSTRSSPGSMCKERCSRLEVRPNENAWLPGQAALRQGQHVGMVGARGDAPPVPTSLSRLPCRWRSRLPRWSGGYAARLPDLGDHRVEGSNPSSPAKLHLWQSRLASSTRVSRSTLRQLDSSGGRSYLMT